MEQTAGASPEISADDRRALLRVARQTLVDHLSGKGVVPPATESPMLRQPRATFVTLRRRDTDELRGCRGECEARHPLVESVALMVIAAAVNDSRFPPVTLDEVPDLKIEISALTSLRSIQPSEILVGRHGLMIIKGDRLGLLLPEVPLRFGWGREDFLGATCRKAGLPENAWKDESARLLGFEAEVWGDGDQPLDDRVHA